VARVRRRRGGWPRRGTKGSGFSSGAIRAVWRAQPWPPRWRRGTRGRRPRQGGLTTALDCSSEQLREQQSGDDQIKGTGGGGLLTLRGSAGVAKQRRRRKDSTGRRQRDSGCVKVAPVSVDQTKQRGRGHTEGCPEQLTVRWSSPWHWTGHGHDGGRRTSSGRRRAVAELPACVGRAREREGERVRQRAQMREGRWASRARGSKGARAHRRGRRTRGRGRVHGGEIVDRRLGMAARWGWRDREGERAHAREPTPTGRPHSAAI
jgi:hypothetical protein